VWGRGLLSSIQKFAAASLIADDEKHHKGVEKALCYKDFC
jgi:hypothetical protein